MSAARLAPLAPAGALALAGVLAQMPGFAQDDVTVFSARADSVAVTIYPDDLALITETRTVELPASAATLVIQDVADTLLPQSAVVNGLERPLAESNFDFNRLSPQSLISHAIGQTVTLIRTNPATGVVTRAPATLVAAGEGVVLETADGNEAWYCSGLPERLVFDAIPDDLYATPQLSLRLAAGDPGERMFEISYLAHGFEWSSDYVAELDAEAGSMDLTGWATVRNSSSKTFDQAELLLVAGQLNVLAAEEGGSEAVGVPAARGASRVDARERLARADAFSDAMLLRACFETELPVRDVVAASVAPQFGTVIVTGSRIPREEFGDYHLYRLPWRTDLGARQTKQVRFLEQEDVTVERFYRAYFSDVEFPFGFNALELFVDESGESETLAILPSIILRTENTARAGLGEPLPAGSVRVFQPYGAGSIFVGQSGIGDRPVGAEIELEIGSASGFLVESDLRVVEEGGRVQLAADHWVINDKIHEVDLELRHFVSDATDLTVDESSRSYELTGDSITWRFVTPPGAEALSYRLSVRAPVRTRQ